MLDYWTVSPEWKGETVYICGGGPSVADQNVELLRGRKVIVINSSCYLLPWADILFFADGRWWREHVKTVEAFAGRVVTTTDEMCGKNILTLRKRKPPGLASDRSELTVLKTGMTASINLAAHLGAKRIVLLGADGGPSKDGRTHHHVPHNWGQIASNWKAQREELSTLVDPLRALGVEVLNASPGSSIPFWPIVSLESCL